MSCVKPNLAFLCISIIGHRITGIGGSHNSLWKSIKLGSSYMGSVMDMANIQIGQQYSELARHIDCVLIESRQPSWDFIRSGLSGGFCGPKK